MNLLPVLSLPTILVQRAAIRKLDLIFAHLQRPNPRYTILVNIGITVALVASEGSRKQ